MQRVGERGKGGEQNAPALLLHKEKLRKSTVKGRGERENGRGGGREEAEGEKTEWSWVRWGGGESNREERKVEGEMGRGGERRTKKVK